jgi:predicted glycogen debranching enzyme
MAPLDVSSIPFDSALRREWLCANHLGGYASSSILGLNTRKYHGLLVAAMTPPVRRMVILSRVEEFVRRDGWTYPLCNSEYPGVIHPTGHQSLRAFDTDPCPRWAWQADGWTVEKQLRLLDAQNTVCLTYVLVGADRPVELELSPLFALRPIHELMYQWNGRLRTESVRGGKHIPATARTPEVFFSCDGRFEERGAWYLNSIYRREQERGYAGLEDLWTPGVIRWTLQPGQPVNFVCSTEPVDLKRALAQADRQCDGRTTPIHVDDPAKTALEQAAGQFVLTLKSEPRPAPGLQRPTEWASLLSIVPWSPPLGRSALIAFDGLLLVTGQMAKARRILLAFIDALRNGLMPSEIPEDGSDCLYNGADISLWFIQAAWQYLQYNPDDRPLRQAALSALEQIVADYCRGTDLGIHVEADGLVNVEAPAATWMDARLGDWVVTPRQGKAVAINALWYNALRIGSQWATQLAQTAIAQNLTARADEARQSFNALFWNESASCCHDVVRAHQPDSAIRPNQLLALSLPFPVLDESRHPAVLETVMAQLLTPMGLRTLSPRDPDYQGRYAGDVVSRDRAYHQGSVFPWLLGPLVTALFRVRGRSEATCTQAMEWIAGPLAYLQSEGMGQLCELFDGDAPHHPGGGIADARAIGELLRCYVEEIQGRHPATTPPAPPRPREQTGATLIVPPIGTHKSKI